MAVTQSWSLYSLIEGQIYGGHTELVTLLLDRGADINKVRYYYVDTVMRAIVE